MGRGGREDRAAGERVPLGGRGATLESRVQTHAATAPRAALDPGGGDGGEGGACAGGGNNAPTVARMEFEKQRGQLLLPPEPGTVGCCPPRRRFDGGREPAAEPPAPRAPQPQASALSLHLGFFTHF